MCLPCCRLWMGTVPWPGCRFTRPCLCRFRMCCCCSCCIWISCCWKASCLFPNCCCWEGEREKRERERGESSESEREREREREEREREREREERREREREKHVTKQNKRMGKVRGRDLESFRMERAGKTRHSFAFISLQPRPEHV